MSKLVEELRERISRSKRDKTHGIVLVTGTAEKLLAHIERLESALALAKQAIGGQCDVPNDCDMCKAWRAIEAAAKGE